MVTIQIINASWLKKTMSINIRAMSINIRKEVNKIVPV
jgi:hypothetical protein